MKFSLFTPKVTSPWRGGGGVMNFAISNFVNIDPIVLEKKMLTNDGRQSISIGHLSDSGDLKKSNVSHFSVSSDSTKLSNK